MYEEIKKIARQNFEVAFNQGKLDLYDQGAAPQLVVHDPSLPGGEIRGREAYKAYMASLLKAFPDLHFTVEDVFAEADRVAVRWTATGTQKGEYLGVPPTGVYGSVGGISISRFEGTKAVETWIHKDDLTMLKLMGIVKLPALAGVQV